MGTTPKKVLIITYYWPPAGGPGVQRVLKFAKYLPGFDWEPLILTVRNGEYPAYDESLLKEVPPGMKVYRTQTREPAGCYKKFTGVKKNEPVPVGVLAQTDRSLKKRIANFIRMNLVIPDAKKAWKRYALREAGKIIRDERPDVILSSSPPPTVHLIARELARRYKLKWVADLRDPWSNIHYYQGRRLKIAAGIDAALERKTLSYADRVLTVSGHFADRILADKNNVRIIPNGYDPDDFKRISQTPPDDSILRIAYIGGMNANRYYPAFFRALRQFAETNGPASKNMELVFAGVVEETIREAIGSMLGDTVRTEFLGYLSHWGALELMYRSDLLLLFMEQVDHYTGHVPGKLFEYLNTGRYILGMGSKEGDTAAILKKTKGGHVIGTADPIEETITDIYTRWEKGELHGAEPASLRSYSRKVQAGRLAEIMRDIVCK
ncbi:MAG: glycosyltransferase [FCB group bacterium]|nr:glycosyltransferase [FCB group bacterium]